MKYSYVTLLSTESYLPGVIALFRSWKQTNPAYPFVCFCSVSVRSEALERLHRLGIATQRFAKGAVDASGISNQAEYSYWRYTFDKLLLWGCTQYDKMVYLDSDMMVMDNLDFLFDCPNLSACQAGRFLHPSWIRLNSGLMVVEPDKTIEERLLRQLPRTLSGYSKQGRNVGDQDVLNDCFVDWPSQEHLHLPEGLNMFFKDITLAGKHGFRLGARDEARRIRVVHFIGSVKPWSLRGIGKVAFMAKVLLRNRTGFPVLLKYLALLK